MRGRAELCPVFPAHPVHPVSPFFHPHSPTLPAPRPLPPDPRIDALLAEVERRWGRGALVRWGDVVEATDVETVPTGFADLDEALGVGGLPCGRISELFGPESSGKQALAASIAAQCQKQDGVVVWIDHAGRLDPEQMSVLGVDLDSLLVARPRNEPQALEMAVRLARSGGVRMMVYDLGGHPQTPAKGTPPGPPPARLSLALRRLVAAVHRNRIAFLFISSSSLITHHSLLITSHRSTGGQALRYFASVRLEMERREWIRRGREVVGCRSSVLVVKNKLAAPCKEAEVDLPFYTFPPSAMLRIM